MALVDLAGTARLARDLHNDRLLARQYFIQIRGRGAEWRSNLCSGGSRHPVVRLTSNLDGNVRASFDSAPIACGGSLKQL